MTKGVALLAMSVILSSCASAPSAHADAEVTPAHRAAIEYLSHDNTLVPLNDPAYELRKIGERGASGASGTMVRFEQLYRGIPVLGTLLVCEVTSDNVVRIRTNELRSIDVSVVPEIEARAAVRAAVAALPVQGRLRQHQMRTELVVVPAATIETAQVDTLAWSVTLEDVQVQDRMRGTWRVLIDAVSRAVLYSDQLLPRD